MRLILLLSLPLIMVALAAGCGGAAPTPQPVPTSAPSPAASPASTLTPLPPPSMPEMEVDSIRGDPENAPLAVLLREKGTDRYLAIGIGRAEATAIAVKLEEVPVPRPLTHDLLNSVITRLGAHVGYVVVSDLLADTFFAKIVLTIDGDVVEVDSRPSDAIALAVRANVPIYAEELVLERAGIILEEGPEALPLGDGGQSPGETR